MRLSDDVALEYYRLQWMSSGAIAFEEDPDAYVATPTAVGTGDPEEEKAPLSEIIERLNERLGTDFKDEDRLFFAQIEKRAEDDEEIRRLAQANRYEKFAFALLPYLQHLMVERQAENEAIVTRYMDDQEFHAIVTEGLARAIYDAIVSPPPEPAP